MVNIEQIGMIGVEVWADSGKNARGLFTFFAHRQVFACHSIHICRRAAQIA